MQLGRILYPTCVLNTSEELRLCDSNYVNLQIHVTKIIWLQQVRAVDQIFIFLFFLTISLQFDTDLWFFCAKIDLFADQNLKYGSQ